MVTSSRLPDETHRMVPCETCGGDGGFDRIAGHDPSGPVYADQLCSTCHGAGEYAVKMEPVSVDDVAETD